MAHGVFVDGVWHTDGTIPLQRRALRAGRAGLPQLGDAGRQRRTSGEAALPPSAGAITSTYRLPARTRTAR